MRLCSFLAAAVLLTFAVPARAQSGPSESTDGDEPTASARAPRDPTALDEELEAVVQRYVDERLGKLGGTIARRFYDRTRRAFTLGVFASGAPSFAFDGEGTDVQVGGGIGMWAYDIDMLPRASAFGRLVTRRALDAARERMAAGSGTPPTAAELEQIARDTWDKLEAELTAEVQPRTFERPNFRVIASVLHGIDASSWDVRLGFAFGVGPVFVGTALAGQWDDGLALILPFELSVPILLSDGFRAPVVEVFTRVEFPANDRDDRADRALVGARFVLDVF